MMTKRETLSRQQAEKLAPRQRADQPPLPQCCQRTWKTPFCGYCGRKLREPSPLRTLLKFLEQRAATARKRKADALAARYTTWAGAVRDHLTPSDQK